jgi:hypothetical protein
MIETMLGENLVICYQNTCGFKRADDLIVVLFPQQPVHDPALPLETAPR